MPPLGVARQPAAAGCVKWLLEKADAGPEVGAPLRACREGEQRTRRREQKTDGSEVVRCQR